nr:MAG TPA: minor tail protein [Caudoviricetes sp.]
MTNFDIARKTLDTALNGSEGSAEKELSNYQQGIEYSLDKLQANFQDFSNTLVDSKAIKGFVDGGSNLLNLFTKLTSSIGTLNTAAIGLGIFQGKTGSGKSTWEFAPCIFQMTYAA